MANAKTALVVDDEITVRRFVGNIVARQGFEILEAEDGQAAWELLARISGAVKLVITDVVMPRMDGLTLGRKIGAEYPNVNVLYISGYFSEESMTDIPESRFLTKPFAPAALARSVHQLCPCDSI